MERLTRRSEDKNSTMVWFVDKEKWDMRYEPCEMDSHQTREVLCKLASYEDAEEQGLLKMLPVAIGSDVYFIPSKADYDLNNLCKHGGLNRVYHQKVARIVFTECGWYIECSLNLQYGITDLLRDESYKETWFTTEAEAEQALAKMKGE